MIFDNNKWRNLYELGVKAYNSGDENFQREVLNCIICECSEIDRMNAINKTRNFIPNGSQIPHILLTREEVGINLYGYCQMLRDKIYPDQPYSVAFGAINILQSNLGNFKQEQVLYQDHWGDLSVKNLLKVTGYALDISSIVFGANVDKYKRGLLVLKGLDKILNNKNTDNDVLDNLGYAVEVLAEVAKYQTDNPTEKKQIESVSFAINLAIDFFSWGCKR